MAMTAVLVARFLLMPIPTPMSTVLTSFITAWTSAKLTNPVLMTIINILTMPCRSMSSAKKKASVAGCHIYVTIINVVLA